MSKYTINPILIMILFITGCASSKPVATQSIFPTYKFYLINKPSKTKDEPGWANYSVLFAIENYGDKILRAENLYGITLDTAQGISYEPSSSYVRVYSYNQNTAAPSPFLPPGFFAQYEVSFKIADAVEPTQFRYGNQVIDVNAIETVTFPTNRPSSEFLSFPYNVNSFKDVELTLSLARVDDKNVELTVTAKNLNQFQDSIFEVPGCRIIDGEGNQVQTFYTNWRYDNVNTGSGYYVGPNQTGTIRIVYYTEFLTGAKLVCLEKYNSETTSFDDSLIFNIE